MRKMEILCFTPHGFADADVAIAACRAGQCGVFDASGLVSGSSSHDAARDELARELQRLEKGGQRRYGVKVDAADKALFSLLSARPPMGCHTILVDQLIFDQDFQALSAWLDLSRRFSWRLLAIVSDVPAALRAASLGANGLILKGNEASGWVGEETSFVLVQRWLAVRSGLTTAKDPRDGLGEELPFWVQGGIGLQTAAACRAVGAAGVVLEGQLLLTKESPLGEDDRKRVQALDGGETVCLGGEIGLRYRFLDLPAEKLAESLQNELNELTEGDSEKDAPSEWHARLQELRNSKLGRVTSIGPEAAWAPALADQNVTVSGVISAFTVAVDQCLTAARENPPLAGDSSFAAAHGISYPIFQGPMTRVSDVAPFANAVASAGALPFLALSMLRGGEVANLLRQTQSLLGEKPWGAGLLGFLPSEVRAEQLTELLKCKPTFAIIAGGRPDQAKVLEDASIPTYLHVPSPGLLRMFLKDGARRFIFEGRECGGHVGPRSSFLLWQTMVQELLAFLGPQKRGDDLHIVFAGGIHDDVSAAMASVIAAPLVERGVRFGVLLGTAYLFTEEAVNSGAIVAKFQKTALSASSTKLLETGPGHAIRCVETPYCNDFFAERRRLEQQGKSHREVVAALEMMNVGRLRVASKGLDRVALQHGSMKELQTVPESDQFARGMYMIGQVAALRDRVISMAQLHAEIGEGSTQLLSSLPAPLPVEASPETPCDVAIIGMACHYPDAHNVQEYWENILRSRYSVQEVPGSHWDWRLFYDADPQAKDRIISKWGGFLGDIEFDPLRYGITPKSMKSIEPLQLLLLEQVRHALNDAGYERRPFNRERTCSVLGIGGGGSPMSISYGLRSCLPLLDTIPGMTMTGQQIIQNAGAALPEWTEDSFPGFLMNVAVGRVANRFDFGGSNYALDAACASSLAAVHACIRELELGTCDVAVAMGADTVQTPYAYMAFSKTHALSKRGRCSPFDEAADGIVLSEGIGVCILKRLEDAERDGDHIYAVIRGVGSSSDGKEKGLTAPNAAGQIRALRRAYHKAGISPADVTLVEAHGTGTVVGDRTEALSLATVMREHGAEKQSCALGSVKSMIGHSKCAAGIAGLIKTAVALDRKTLPPTLVTEPNKAANLEDSALYLNTTPRPWLHDPQKPRTAGVSAFGFGGTNCHVVLQEYADGIRKQEPAARTEWPSELFAFRAETASLLLEKLQRFQKNFAQRNDVSFGQLAAAVGKEFTSSVTHPTLCIVATGLQDLLEKTTLAAATIQSGPSYHEDPRGIYWAEKPSAFEGETAWLFPGQGSQYVDMLAETALNFPLARAALDSVNGAFAGVFEKSLASLIYPPSAFGEEAKTRQQKELARTDVAQAAIGATSLALVEFLQSLGLQPDCTAGHSYGEITALAAAGCLSTEQFLQVTRERGRWLREASEQGGGGMLALDAEVELVEGLVRDAPGIYIANYNSPKQTVVSGSQEAMGVFKERCKAAGVSAREIPVSCGFHSPLIAKAGKPFADFLRSCSLQKPNIPVYSNTDGRAYPSDPREIIERLCQHVTSPVRFRHQIENMYASGVRRFIEVGPAGVLTSLVKQSLGDRPHLAVSLDARGKSGITQIQSTLARLIVSGLRVRLDSLFKPRFLRAIGLNELAKAPKPDTNRKNLWLVNGIRCKPIDGPEPKLLGQRQIDNSAEAKAPSPTPQTAGAQVNIGHTASASRPMETQESTYAAKGMAQTPKGNVSHANNGNTMTAQGGNISLSPSGRDSAPQAGNLRLSSSRAMPAAGDDGVNMKHAAPFSASVTMIKQPLTAPVGDKPKTETMTETSMKSAPHTVAESAALNGHAKSSYSPSAAEALPQPLAQTGGHSLPATTLGLSQNSATLAMSHVNQPSPAAAQVVLGFQSVMQTFLETQRQVMLAYLQKSGQSANAPSVVVSQGQTSPLASARPEALAPQGMGQLQTQPPSGNGSADKTSSSQHIATAQQPFISASEPAQVGAPSFNGSLASHPTQAALQGTNEIATLPSTSAPSLPASVVEPVETFKLSREALEKHLLELISDRTGYPLDMLGVDLDLEADLGIDSIKRVETLGKLAEVLQDAVEGLDDKLDLEKLVGIRTIRGILDFLDEALFASAPAKIPQAKVVQEVQVTPPSSTHGSPSLLSAERDAGPLLQGASETRAHLNGHAPSMNGHGAKSPIAAEIQRGLVTLIDRPIENGGFAAAVPGVLILTNDGQGIAAEFAGRLADLGQNIAMVDHDAQLSDGEFRAEGHGSYACCLDNERSVKSLLARIREDFGVHAAGLIHFLPLAKRCPQELWESRASLDVKSLYLLARAMEADLLRSPSAVFIGATGMGGELGFGQRPLAELGAAGHGAILGFLKCLGLEWPTVLVRAVDVDPSADVNDIVETFIAELSDPHGPLEVGVRDGRRVTWEPVPGVYKKPAEVNIPKGSTILLTGGARGITAAVAEELGKRYQPRLVIVGRSPAPETEEAPETARFHSTADIKRVLIDKRKASGQSASPSAIEEEYQTLLRNREIRANLQRIRATGAEVQYYACDVRNLDLLRDVVRQAEAQWGPIVAVVHGAGVIEDKLVKDKTPESFDRVFTTKVNSTANLLQVLNPEQLKVMIFFSSIASRYGNRGQADYAAANEVQSKLAHDLDRRWPGRVLAIAWGPWSTIGMVSNLEQHLSARGVALIPPAAGVRFVIDEIERGVRGESEVLVAGGAENLLKPQAARKADAKLEAAVRS